MALTCARLALVAAVAQTRTASDDHSAVPCLRRTIEALTAFEDTGEAGNQVLVLVRVG
jgi:hypothetical protein